MYQRRLTTLFVGLILLASLPLSAQELGDWERVPDVPGHEFQMIWPGDSTLLATYGGELLISHDGGMSWRRPATDETSYHIHVGNHGLVVGLTTEGRIIRSTDHGDTFARVDTAWGYSLTKETTYQLIGRNDEIYYSTRYLGAVTSPPLRHLFHSSDGGLSWEEIPYPSIVVEDMIVTPQGTLLGIDFSTNAMLAYDAETQTWSSAATLPDSTTAVRLGHDGRLYALRYDGLLYRSDSVTSTSTSTFTFSSFPLPIPINGGGDVEIMRNGDVIASPSFLIVGMKVVLLRIAATGALVDSLPIADQLSNGSNGSMGIVVDDNDRIWSVGYGDVFSVTMTSEESGATILDWRGHPIVARMKQTYADHPADEFLLMTTNHIYRGDGEFTRMSPPAYYIAQMDIDLIDSTTLIFPTGSNLILRSSDGGATWTEVRQPGARTARDGRGNLYAFGGITTPPRSVDSGRSWKKINAVKDSRYIAAREADVIIIGYGETYRSADYGETWDTLAALKDNTNMMGMVTGERTFIGGQLFESDTTESDYFLISHDDDTVLARTLPCPVFQFLFSEHFVSDPYGRPHYMGSCGIFRSDDDGMTWKKLGDYPDGAIPTALLIMEDETFYLGTTDGLYKTTRVSSAPSQATNVAGPRASIRLLSSSGDVSTILLDLPTATRVTIALHDLEGRQVAMIHDGEMASGEHALPMAMPVDIAAGAYLLVMRTADGESVATTVRSGWD